MPPSSKIRSRSCLACRAAFVSVWVWLAGGCHPAGPRVDNPFSGLRVDITKGDAPTYSLLVHNNTADRLQVGVTTASRGGPAGAGHEERFVLEPHGDAAFPLAVGTAQVRITQAKPFGL